MNALTCIEIRGLMQKQIQVGTLSADEERLINEYLNRQPLMHFFLYAIEAMRYDYGKPPRNYYKERLEERLKNPRILDEDY